METNRITDTLKKTFPHWTEKQVSDFLKFLSSCFRDLSRSDEHIVLSTLNDSIIKVIQKYDIPSTQPGRLRTIYRRNMLKLYNKKSRTPYFDGIADYLGEQFDGLDQVESIEKINRFFKVVRSSGILTDALEPLCDHIEIVARKMLDELGDGKEKWSRKDFWEEVEQSLLNKGVTLTDVNYRQLQKRLRDRITGKRPDAEGLLHLAQKNTEEANALQILYAALTAARSRTDYLQAYRFTVEELDKMIWLKKEVFEKNGFSFDPNRFPEVYYDDYEKVNPDDNHWNPDNINPDVFGIYIYRYETSSNLPCADSYEGHIILFKDRIEAYCNRSGADIDSVRFVVLMHELGHWLSHWPTRENYNWKIGFHLDNKHTKEALAQLVAYWACVDNPFHFETLLKLTPKVLADPDKLYILKLAKDARLDDGTVINTEDPYGRYWLLKDKPIVVVLKKLHQLREGWMLKDEKMMEFLISEYENLEQWMKSKVEIPDGDLIIKMDDRNCIRNISPMLLRLKGFESLSKGYKLLGGIGADGKWYENTSQ